MATEDSRESRYSSIVQKCIKFIWRSYASAMSLEDAAAEVAVSKGYLSMLFKQETGVNFVSYLNHFRIEKSKELILNTDLKIYEIALQVGFESPYYFSKLFKEVTGMGCREYRNLHCGKTGTGE
jgi:two-component system response regulator YesN